MSELTELAEIRRLRIITTVEELDALPDGTAVKDEANLLEKEDGRWFYGDDSNVEVTLPAVVLWEGGVDE